MTKYLLVLLLVFATAISGFSQTAGKTRAEAYYHFSKARLLDDQGQASQAIDEYKKAVGGIRKGKGVLLLVRRGESTLFLALKPQN